MIRQVFRSRLGTELSYCDAGDGPGILMIHGWTCDGSDWYRQLPVLSRHFRVVTVDLPGHGRSSPSAAGYHTTTLSSLVAELVNAITLDRPTLITHSLGSVIGARFAIEHSQCLSSLVSIEPAYGAAISTARPAFDLLSNLRTTKARDHLRSFVYNLDTPTTPKEVRELHLARLSTLDIRVATDMLASLWQDEHQISLEPESTAYLSHLSWPLVEFYTDPLRPLWDWSKASLPIRQRRFLAGLGHWPHQEEPTLFNSHLTNWLTHIHPN